MPGELLIWGKTVCVNLNHKSNLFAYSIFSQHIYWAPTICQKAWLDPENAKMSNGDLNKLSWRMELNEVDTT